MLGKANSDDEHQVSYVDRESVLVFEPDSEFECSHYADAIVKNFPELQVKRALTKEDAIEGGKDTSILVAKSVYVFPEIIGAMDNLKWVHSLISGTDAFAKSGISDDVIVTATRGIHGPQMAELALLQMMSLARDYRRVLKNQDEHQWIHWPQPLLFGKSIAIVGVGLIAEVVAKRCQAFDMTVTGVSAGRATAPNFDKIYSRDDIFTAVSEADFVLVLTPYTAASHHMIDAPVLAAMKGSAFLVNMARGNVVDEVALLNALDTGEISGVASDVFAEEPLPTGNALWSHPKSLVTPHIGGRSDVYHLQVTPLLIDNIDLFLSDRSEEMPFRVRMA